MITIFNLDEASIAIKLAISSESVCDLILENQLSYHIWYRRAPFLRATDVANGAKREFMEIIFMK